ncbi:MAG TPA: hypothetical protein DD706_02240 [Nitrospiraceae bacterium]|nr:hypothetical protein [Nitrospiraceae bacterium]
MRQKRVKRRRRHNRPQIILTRLHHAVSTTVDTVNQQSLVRGFMLGLVSMTLGTYHPALAQNWQPTLPSDSGVTTDHPGDLRQTHSPARQTTPSLTASPEAVRLVADQEMPAPSTTQSFDIPEGSLAEALQSYSHLFEWQFLYPSDLVVGKRTQGVRGTYSKQDALGRLLKGTGVAHRFSHANTVILYPSEGAGINGAGMGKQGKRTENFVVTLDPVEVRDTVIHRPAAFLPPVEGYKADQATGSTRSALPISETPSSIGVVTRDAIRDTMSRSQNDAFEQTSGISRGNLAFGRSESFNIRGFNMGGANNASSIRQNGLAADSLFSLDPALIERYEIIKGPASITGGASSPGGLVNRITKSPQDENFATSEFQAGSFSLLRGVMDANGVLPQNKNLRGRLVFAVEDGGNFVDKVDVRQYTLAPSLEMSLFGGAGTLLLTGHYQKFDGSSYIGFPLMENGKAPDIPRSRNFGGGSKNGAKTNFEGQNYELHYNHDFINNLTLSVRGKYSKSDLTDKTIYGYNYGGSIPSSGLSYVYSGLRKIDIETYAGEAFLSKEFEAFGQKHEVLVGADYRHQKDDFLLGYANLGTDNIFNPANNFQAPSDEVLENNARNPRSSTLIQTGLFGQAVVRPFEPFTLVAAGRYDWADVDNTTLRTNETLNKTYSEFTGRVGGNYELFPWMRLYAGYSQSFQVNTNSTTVDGSLLPPETGENYEVGAKLDLLDNRLRITTALFRSYRQNVSTRDPANPGFQIAVGEQRHQGVEFDVNGRPLPGLNLIGAFTYFNAEITKDNDTANEGSTPNQIPKSYVGRIFATYELQSGPLQGLGFGGGVYFQSGFELQIPNNVKTDAYERVDAVLFYRPPQKAYDFTINVRNLLDATYIESPGTPTAYNQFGSPVSVFGTLRVKFSPDLDWSLW